MRLLIYGLNLKRFLLKGLIYTAKNGEPLKLVTTDLEKNLKEIEVKKLVRFRDHLVSQINEYKDMKYIDEN